MNPDKEMVEAASKVQGLFRKRQSRKKSPKKKKPKPVEPTGKKIMCCTDGSKRALQAFMVKPITPTSFSLLVRFV